VSSLSRSFALPTPVFGVGTPILLEISVKSDCSEAAAKLEQPDALIAGVNTRKIVNAGQFGRRKPRTGFPH
jgi:hypothetical protein